MIMFVLTKEQSEKVDKCTQSLDNQYCGAIGGRLTYLFTPTTIGMIVKVKDSISGKEIDVTDYESW